MSVTLLITYFIVLVMLGIAGFVVLGSMRSKGALARALNMSLFLITMPRDTTGQGQRPEKELIGIMEQLLSTFSNIHAKGWNKFIYGEPYIGLEMAVHNSGEEIHFYMAVPRTYEQIFEKQVHGVFPTAQIERVEDYNIFHSGGSSLGAYCALKENPILPIKTYQNLQTDPLGGMVTAFSKIQAHGEGAALQILIRPSHRADKKLAMQVVQAMQKGIPFKQALYTKNTPAPDQSQPNMVTPLDQEVMKTIQNKASQLVFLL
ncbi:hypothetical protein KW791_03550, partial [Candidatus Parcubacteria bacterium]|nr:hypothetical protein [Candidatus Parcubacteria bacterium]